MTQILEWAEKNFKLLYSHYKDVQGSKGKDRHNKEIDEKSKLRKNIINGNKIKILELLKILMFMIPEVKSLLGVHNDRRNDQWT